MSRIIVVDDHPIFRAGLVALLISAGDDVIAEAASATEAIALATQLEPDVVVMDLGLPDGSGIHATARITGERPEVRVLVVTLFDDDGTVREALAAGAAGYVVKDATPAQLLAAVRAVEQGATVLGPGLEGGAPFTEALPDPFGLTARERDVAALILKGLPNRAIAERLGLATKTIANIVSTILLKTGAPHRADAAQRLRAR